MRTIKTINDMFLKDAIWFSPINVISEFKKLEKSPGFVNDKKVYKKACEMYVAAINLVGIIKLTGRQSWLQLVDDSEETPDVRTDCYYKIKRDVYDQLEKRMSNLFD